MNKSMQILSEEMLVICRSLSGLNHCCFEGAKWKKLFCTAANERSEILDRKIFHWFFFILIITLKRRSIFLCFKAKRSCFLMFSMMLFFLSGEIWCYKRSREKLDIVQSPLRVVRNVHQSDDVRSSGIWFCVCSFTRHIWKTRHWQLVFEWLPSFSLRWSCFGSGSEDLY